jgi:hypothetical protein
MTVNRAIGEDLTEAVGQGEAGKRGTRADGGASDQATDIPRLLQLLLRAQIIEGDLTGAADSAARLARMPEQPDAMELLVDVALDTGAVQIARTAISEAEAGGAIQPSRAAYHKARIALETGDLLAARAILVLALDAAPGNAALRTLLAEAMVAAGTAADARAVLGHIGRPPVNPHPEDARDMKGMPTTPAAASSGSDPAQG